MNVITHPLDARTAHAIRKRRPARGEVRLPGHREVEPDDAHSRRADPRVDSAIDEHRVDPPVEPDANPPMWHELHASAGGQGETHFRIAAATISGEAESADQEGPRGASAELLSAAGVPVIDRQADPLRRAGRARQVDARVLVRVDEGHRQAGSMKTSTMAPTLGAPSMSSEVAVISS